MTLANAHEHDYSQSPHIDLVVVLFSDEHLWSPDALMTLDTNKSSLVLLKLQGDTKVYNF